LDLIKKKLNFIEEKYAYIYLEHHTLFTTTRDEVDQIRIEIGKLKNPHVETLTSPDGCVLYNIGGNYIKEKKHVLKV